MPMSFLRRAGGLAAATFALCFGATGVAQADLVRAYDFPGGELDASFDATDEDRTPLKAVGATNDVFTEGQGYVLATTGITGRYVIDLSVHLNDLDPNPGAPGDFLQILRFADTGSGTEKDAGIYVEDGRLRVVEDGGTGVGDPSDPLTPNADLRLTIVFDPSFSAGPQILIYRDGDFGSTAVDVFASGSFGALAPGGATLFRDDRSPAVAQLEGQMQRLRLFTAVDDVSALHQFDESGPEGTIIDNGNEVIQDGELWMGPYAFFSMRAVDDGTAPVSVDAAVYNPDGSGPVASDQGGPSSVGANTGNEELTSLVGSTFELGTLSEGIRYRFRARLYDKVGNFGDVERFFYLDKTPPSGLTLDTPAETVDRSPAIGGSAVIGVRDEDHVFGSLCKGDACDETEDDYVASFDAAIVNGRWGTSVLKRYGQDGSSTPVRSLPLGTYAVTALHFDRVGNLVEVKKVINVVEPKKAAPSPSPVVVTRPVAPQLLSPVALLQRNRGTILASLLREGLRGLTKDGKAAVDVFTDRPAAIVVQLFDGTAPKKVDAKASAAAKRKRKKKAVSKLIATGRRTFFAPGTGKLTVKLTKRGKALLKNKKRRRVSVRTIIVPRGGAPIADTATVTLKR